MPPYPSPYTYVDVNNIQHTITTTFQDKDHPEETEAEWQHRHDEAVALSFTVFPPA